MGPDRSGWEQLADSLLELARAAAGAGVDAWELLRPFLLSGAERLVELLS